MSNSPISGALPRSRQRRQAFGSDSCGHQSGTASHHFGPRRCLVGSDEPAAWEFATGSALSDSGPAAGMRAGRGTGGRVVEVGDGVAVGVGDVARGVGDGSDVCADGAEAAGSSRAGGSELPIAIAAATTAATAATVAATARTRPADFGRRILDGLCAGLPDAGATAPAAVAAGETTPAYS